MVRWGLTNESEVSCRSNMRIVCVWCVCVAWQGPDSHVRFLGRKWYSKEDANQLRDTIEEFIVREFKKSMPETTSQASAHGPWPHPCD